MKSEIAEKILKNEALDKLIDKFIESKWTMINASVDYFADSCVVSGIFRAQLRNMLNEACNGKPEPDTDSGLHIACVSGSWLYNHALEEDSKIDGVLIKHHNDPGNYGGVAVKTLFGNFALVSEDQTEACKNIGAKVKVQPHKKYYGTVIILQYHDR